MHTTPYYNEPGNEQVGQSIIFTASGEQEVIALANEWYGDNVINNRVTIEGVEYEVHGKAGAIMVYGNLWVFFWILMYVY